MIKIGRSKIGTPSLIAYPGFGYPLSGGSWCVNVAGVVWQEPVVFSMRQRMIIRMLGNVMKASPDQLKCDNFQNRITPFFAEAEQRQSITVEVSGRSHRLRKKTKSNGHFRELLKLSRAEVEQSSVVDEFGNRILPIQVTTDHPKSIPATGQIHLLEPQGLSVISDIDDTIKDSFVTDRRELLNNTFLRDFRSIDGMADVYRELSVRGANFHYVSSSPWQLFESLQELNDADQFPSGTMHLRNFRLRDQLLKKLIIRRHGKTIAIRFLMKHLPNREFVLIGDSGEKDPEIYRKICRQFPNRVKALFIREIDERPLDEERDRKLAGAINGGIYGKFRDADQLKELSASLF